MSSNIHIHVNKITDEQKNKFNSRTKTSIFIVLYSLLIMLLGMLSSIENPWFSMPKEALLSFGILFLISISIVLFFASIELQKCYLKRTTRGHIIYIGILTLLSSFISTLSLFPYIYGFDTKAPYEVSRNIFLGIICTSLGLLFFELLFLSLRKKDNSLYNKISYPLIGTLLPLVFYFIAYVMIFKFFTTFLYLMMVTWMTDTFAYVGGSLFGVHRMCPKISPNKTWEGFFVSILMGTILLLALLGAYSPNEQIKLLVFGRREFLNYDMISNTNWWLAMLFGSFALTLVNTFGDLFFSQIKRKNGIKDFSDLLPGHGGVLDRIDALFFIILFYCATCFIFSIYHDPSMKLLFITIF